MFHGKAENFTAVRKNFTASQKNLTASRKCFTVYHYSCLFLGKRLLASPCVAERLGATTGATIGVTTGATKLLGTALDFQAVKCQV